MKFQAILRSRDFIMNCSLLLPKALQNAFPHRACRPKMPSWLGEEAQLYAFPPSAFPPKFVARHCPNSGQGTSIRPLSVISKSYWVGVGCVSTLF